MKTYYIYILYDPTLISNRFYVGYSYQPYERLGEHIRHKYENEEKDEWVAELKMRDVIPHTYIVTGYSLEEHAWDAEIALIAFLRRLGIHLLNQADGGEKPPRLCGQANGFAKLTQAQVDEIRDRFLNDGVCRSILANEYGISLTQVCGIVAYKVWKEGIDITPELMSKVAQRIEEEKANRGTEEPWNKGKKMTVEYCEKNSLAHTGLKQTDETRQKRSRAMKGKMPKNIDLLHSPEVAKKRGIILSGEGNPIAKLTEAQVIDMRNKHANKEYTTSQLATLFGISYYTAWDIIKRRSWTHI